MNPKPEVGEQRPEVRSQKSEVRFPTADLRSLTSAPLFFAYRTVWSLTVHVKSYDFDDEIGALMSPSVESLVKGFEARNYEEAVALATREFAAGRFVTTFAGRQGAEPKLINSERLAA